MKKSLTAGLGALALAASAASVALIGGSGASHAAGEPSSAYGAELTIAGNDVIAADTVAVESTDGSLVTDSLADVPGDPLVNLGLIEVLAENGHAKATVANLAVGDGLLAQLPPELSEPLGDVCAQLTDALNAPVGQLLAGVNDLFGSVDATLAELNAALGDQIDLSLLNNIGLGSLLPEELAGLCDALAGELSLVGAGVIEAECNGNTGTGTIADLTALGLPINVSAEPNSTAGIEGLLEVTVNRQTQNANGTFTVDALHLNLLGEIDLTLASATCGEVTSSNPPPDGEAPSPTPVPTNFPVTG